MKKGLFSILAGALLVVGCQNYDDQFSNIESQITALASQVAGLSQVQSDLTSLAGTVNALQANIGDTVDAALADGLADIDTAVASLEAATESAASSEDVAAIADAVAGQQSDLDAILQASQFFTGNVIVTNAATLETYHNARAGFKIINGNVQIDVSSDMDLAKVQELVDAISQATGSYQYTAGAGVTTEIYFNKLTSTATLTIDQQGGYELKTLANATAISLDFHSTTDIVHLGALKSVISLESTGDGAGTFHFKDALEMHLTSLPRYGATGAGTLSLKVDEGAVIDITALTDANAALVKQALKLTIDGPTSVTVPGLTGNKTGSSLTLANVTTVNLTDYDGAVTIGKEVANFTSNGLVELTITGDDLESFDVTGILDPNASTADKLGPTISLLKHNSLASIKIAGTVLSATISDTGAETIDLGGDADALVVQNGITIIGNDDVTSVDMTGTTASGITYSGNENLESLTIDATFTAGVTSKGVANATGINGTVSIVDNEDLATLEISSTKLETLTITGNEGLDNLSASGALAATATAAIGATGKASVNIYNNGLTATSMVDTADTVTTPAAAVVNGGVSDIGTITSISGLGTFKAYFTAVDADADSGAAVYFDTVDQFTSEAGANTTGLAWTQAAATAGTLPDQIKVLVLTANTADLGDAVTTAKRSFLLNLGTVGAIGANNISFNTNSELTAGISMNAAYSAIVNKTTLAATSSIAEVTLTATKYGSPQAEFRLSVNGTTVENSYTSTSAAVAGGLGAPAVAFSFGVSDSMTLSVDGSAVTITGASVIAETTTATPLGSATSVRAALIAAWNTKYAGNALGTASANEVRWALSGTGGASNAAVFRAIAKDRGSREIGAAMALTHSQGKTTTDSNIGIKIGNDISLTQSVADNIARGTYLMVTLTAQTAGSLLSQIGLPGAGQAAAVKSTQVVNVGSEELTSTYVANTTASNSEIPTNLRVAESRLDVVVPEEANAAATSNQVTFSRVGWFD